MDWWIAALNTLVALAGAGFGIVALVRPGVLAPPSEAGAAHPFFAAMYAARAVPLGLAVGIAVWLTIASEAVRLLLGVAIVAQAADIVIGVASRRLGMAAGGAFAAICHGTAIVSSF